MRVERLGVYVKRSSSDLAPLINAIFPLGDCFRLLIEQGKLAGYIFAKIGRAAALLLGGSLIALQCAVQQDVIHINWRKVERAGDRIQSNTPVIFEGKRALKNKIIKTIEENRVFFGSFGGGFLIAISFA
ncbi:unnamed protein product [Schistosoma rodhaini]|nr:unnamed protein product [Schistosoma rodhaini]